MKEEKHQRLEKQKGRRGREGGNKRARPKCSSESRERKKKKWKHKPPDSEWLQPPQGPRLGTGFTRLIVDYPEDDREA